MKKILLLIVVFFYVYPIFLKALPIPLDRVLQIMGFGLLVLNPQDRKTLATSRYVIGFLSITLILLLLAGFAQIQSVRGYDLYFIIRIFNTFLEFFSAYLVFWVARWCYNTVNLGTVLYYIVLVGVIQTFISAVFFVNPSYYYTYSSFLNSDVMNKEESNVLTLLKVRFIGVGSAFFSGVTRYGIAFFSVLILPYVYTNKLISNRLLYWGAVLLIFSGGMLTGRTFIVAAALGLLMITLLSSKTILDFIGNNIKILLATLVSLPILYFVLSSLVELSQLDRMLNYTFELFVNYFSGSGFETRSTNRQLEMYIFPETITTWLFGDGQMQNSSGGYYMKTDIGYIRLLFYFGLPSTLFFIYMLFRYTKILSLLSQSKVLSYFFLTVLFWFLILYFKGLASYSNYFVLFLLFLVLSKKSQLNLSTDIKR